MVPVTRDLRPLEGQERYVSLHKGPGGELRSDKQNKLLWGWIYRFICDETGNDPMTVHVAMKREAVRQGVLDPQYILVGSTLLETEPTTKVDIEAFSRFVTFVKHFSAHDLGIVIPDPEDI